MDLIYVKPKTICPELCREIISMFEQQNGKYEGVTASGLQKQIKDTTDYIIPRINDCPETIQLWSKIDIFLQRELTRNTKRYVQNINNGFKTVCELKDHEYNVLNNDHLVTNEFMVQRYIQNRGRYVYHHDHAIQWNEKRQRVITYIFYLNTVDEGGETEFFGGSCKIKPEEGQLVLFPASWTFPHRGIMPVSSNKYIITGWLWMKD